MGRVAYSTREPVCQNFKAGITPWMELWAGIRHLRFCVVVRGYGVRRMCLDRHHKVTFVFRSRNRILPKMFEPACDWSAAPKLLSVSFSFVCSPTYQARTLTRYWALRNSLEEARMLVTACCRPESSIRFDHQSSLEASENGLVGPRRITAKQGKLVSKRLRYIVGPAVIITV